MILKLRIGKYRLGCSIYKDKDNKVVGYTNRCSDGKYIIFLDYDNMELDWIAQELSYMIHDYKLGNFYIMQSSEESYHAVCFSKIPFKLLKEIMYNASIDNRHISVPLNMGKRLITLRLSEKDKNKIKFVAVVFGNGKYLESYEHKRLLEKLKIINIEELPEDINYYKNSEKLDGNVIMGEYKI